MQTFNCYQDKAMRTNDRKGKYRIVKRISDCLRSELEPAEMLNACLGLSGEVGEVNDIIKKWVFHGHDLDKDELEKEIGDILWYVALMCDSINVRMEDIAKKNIKKLEKRYKDGFSESQSINRIE